MRLTLQGREILTLQVRYGLDHRKIAYRLGLTPKAVKSNQYELMKKHGAHSQAQLLYRLLKQGLVELGDFERQPKHSRVTLRCKCGGTCYVLSGTE